MPLRRPRMPTDGDRAIHLLRQAERFLRRHRAGRGHARDRGRIRSLWLAPHTGGAQASGFSEDVPTSYRTRRDEALSATGGAVTKVKRVDGRDDGSGVHAGWAHVHDLHRGDDCGSADALGSRCGGAGSGECIAHLRGERPTGASVHRVPLSHMEDTPDSSRSSGAGIGTACSV